jgi:hypothetical protein
MGTTLYDEDGPIPTESLKQHTYWNPPLYFLANAALFKLSGFGVFQVRAASILWGITALASWYILLRCGGNSEPLSLVVTGFIGLGYFFLISASFGRMDMMCLALGTAGLASYCVLRPSHLNLALFVSNCLVAASGLTHPVGIMYFCGLAFLVLSQDAKRLRWRHLAVVGVPYIVGAVGWSAYILEDPAGFRDQMRGQLIQTSISAGIPTTFAPLMALKSELIHRYAAPFGLGPGVGAANRVKSVVLLGYLVGLVGILSIRRLRDDTFLRTLCVLAGINFAVLAFVATSKNFYYLPHTTAVFSACLALFLLRLPVAGGRGQLLALVVLLGLAALQITGLLIKAREEAFKKVYLPAIASIQKNSDPGSLIFGPSHLWFYVQPDRTLVHDWTLGDSSGRRGTLIVLDPLMDELLRQAQLAHSPHYEHDQQLINRSRKIFENGYYRIYSTVP